MIHCLVAVNFLILMLGLFAGANALALSPSTGITYTGRILDSDDKPVTASNVIFTLTISDPDQKCWLYREQRQLDLSTTAGSFSFEVGSNDSTLVSSSASLNNQGAAGSGGPESLADIFSNRRPFTGLVPLTYTSCSGTYDPSTSTDPNEGRILAIYFSVNGGQAQALPSLRITPVPSALQAMSLNGYDKKHVLRIDPGIVNPSAADLNATQLTELYRLMNNPLTAYMPANPTIGGDITATSLSAMKVTGLQGAAVAAPISGDIGKVLTYNGTSYVWTTPAAGGITSLNGQTNATQSFAVGNSGTDFNISSSGGTHTFSIPNASSSNRGLLTQADWNTFNSKQSGTLASGQVWIGNASNGAQAQTLSGDATVNNSGVVTVDKTQNATGSKILQLDSSGNAYVAGVDIKGSSATAKLRFTGSTDMVMNLPTTSGTANQFLQTDGAGNLSWGSQSAMLPTISAGQVWVGNSSNGAQAFSLTGDIASVSSTGVVTLSSSATGSNKLPLAGGTMSGAINMGGSNISNAGDVSLAAGKFLGLGVGTTAGTVTGQMWYDGGVIKYFDGTTTQSLGVAGSGITSLNGLNSGTQSLAVGTSGTAPTFNSSGSTHTLNIPMASSASVTAGLISNADYASIMAKQSSALPSTQVWVGNASGAAAAVSLSGDVASITNAGVVTVNKTTTGQANYILALDGTGVANVKGLDVQSGTGKVTLLTAGAFTNYTLTLPNASPAANQIMKSDPSGNLSWVTYLANVSDSAPLTNGKMWIGNASGVASEVTISGDATITNAGLLTLKNTGTIGTYTKVITDAQGRVTSGSALASGDVTAALGYTPADAAAAGYVNGGNTFSGNATIGLNDAYNLGFKTSGLTRMTLDAGGKLGIGTASPTAALDVNGAINISGANGMSYPSTDSTAGASIAIGSGALAQQSLLASAAYRNTAVGYQALSSSSLTSSAVKNTALGYKAGASITTGFQNTFIGESAGTGSGPTRTSTAVGANTAINAGSSGYDVVIVGANSSCCGGGTGGIVVGASSAGSNNGGIAIGNAVNQWGDASISIGTNSAVGNYNTVVIGGSAKSSSWAGIALGASAGSANVTGAYNVLIGTGVGSTTLTTGARNLLIGVDNSTDVATATANNSMNIGNAIYATNMKNATNTTGVAKIGINNNSPAAVLDVTDTSTTTSAIIVPRAGTFTGTTADGMVRYNTATNLFEFRQNGAWVNYTTGVGGSSLVVAPSVGSLIGGTTSASTLTTAGLNNTAYGYQTLNGVTSNGSNTAVGYQAMTLDNGSANTAIGYQAAYSGGGGENVAIGNKAFYNSDTGNQNTAVGGYALFGSQGVSGNTAVGYDAGVAVTSGAGNVLFGWEAGNNITTGSKNIVIGYNIGAPTATGSNQLTIGNMIYGTGISGTGTTASTGKIGIGKNNPSSTFDVLGEVRISGATSGYVGFAVPAVAGSTTYTWPVAPASDGMLLSSTTGGTLSWVANPSTSAYVNGGNSFTGNATIGLNDAYTLGFKTNNTTRMTLDASGKLGIGTATPTAALDVNGAINISGVNAISYGAGSSQQSLVIGNGNSSSGYKSIVMGYMSSAGGNNSIAIGASTNASVADTIVIGYSSNSKSTNGIVIGEGSGSFSLTGANNLILGSGVASTTLTTGARNIMIGVDNSTDSAAAATSNSMNIGNAIYATNMKNATNTTGAAKVGINNNSPSVTLDIGSATDAVRLPAGTTAQQPTAAAGLIRYNTDNSNIEFNNGTTWTALASSATGGYANGGNSFAGNATIGLNDAYTLGFKTGGSTRMTLDASGNLGVGTATPQQKVDINGNSVIRSTTTGNWNEGLSLVRATTSDFSWTSWHTGTSATSTPSTTDMDFGIGQNAGDSDLWLVASGMSGSSIGRTDGALRVSKTTGDIYVGGKLGIGTTSPTSTLQVNGTANATTFLMNGSSSAPAAKVTNAAEPVNVSATAATGTVNFYLASGAVQYYTSNATANWTLNWAWSAGTSLNSAMSVNDSVTTTFLVTQGSTPYYPSTFKIDGTTVTPKWLGGSAPTTGNASSIDVYTCTIIKTASAVYSVLCAQAQYK